MSVTYVKLVKLPYTVISHDSESITVFPIPRRLISVARWSPWVRLTRTDREPIAAEFGASQTCIYAPVKLLGTRKCSILAPLLRCELIFILTSVDSRPCEATAALAVSRGPVPRILALRSIGFALLRPCGGERNLFVH